MLSLFILSKEQKVELLHILNQEVKFTENPFVAGILSHEFYKKSEVFTFDWSFIMFLATESDLNGLINIYLNTYNLHKFLPKFLNETNLNISLDINKLGNHDHLFFDIPLRKYMEVIMYSNNFNEYTFAFSNGWYNLDFYLCIPEIFFFFSFLIIFTFIILFNFYNKIQLVNLFFVFSFLIMIFLYLNNFSMNYDLFFFSFTSNYYIYICRLIVLSLSILFLFLISHFVKYDNIKTYEYIILYSLIVYSLILILGVNDFIGLFLCLELQTLSLYILAAYKTTSTYSTEAGIKYFVLGAIATGMILFGISIIYGFIGMVNFSDLSAVNFFIRSMENTGEIKYNYHFLNGNALNFFFPINYLLGQITVEFLDTYYLDFFSKFNLAYFIGFFFILVGIFFKLGVAPFHMWLPDVYEGSPTITTAFFALIPKISLVFLFIRLITIHFYYVGDWYLFFTICAILSIFIGTFGALYQIKIKRLIAYSAISHIGFIILSLSNFTLFNFISAFFYINAYIILSFIFFSILITLRKYNFVELKNINDLSALVKNNPLLAIFFSLNLFSIAGIPPLMGFFSKLMVLFVTVNNEMWFIILIVLILSMISVFYYIRLIKLLFFDLNDNFTFYYSPSKGISYIIVIFSFLNLFFFFIPNIFFIEICNVIFYLV